jgi:hypothetical protein
LEILINHFENRIVWFEKLDAPDVDAALAEVNELTPNKEKDKAKEVLEYAVNSFAGFLNALETDDVGVNMKNVILKRGIMQKFVNYLVRVWTGKPQKSETQGFIFIFVFYINAIFFFRITLVFRANSFFVISDYFCNRTFTHPIANSFRIAGSCSSNSTISTCSRSFLKFVIHFQTFINCAN